ncbi:MAG: hypothetical protein ACTJHM_06960 [Agrococcus casei]|uniref:hypothetical protein n=1 Tax=Agrococcus casei TaxID=343512 RepID=UPI003F8FB168
MTLHPQNGTPGFVPGLNGSPGAAPGQPQPMPRPGMQPGMQPAGPALLKDGVSSGPTAGSDDVPWVVGTRLAPDQKVRKSIVWGIAAMALTLLHLIVAGIGYGAMVNQGDPQVFFSIMPWWGICTLALLASIVGCFVKRGALNIIAGVIATLTIVISNPALPLALIVLVA